MIICPSGLSGEMRGITGEEADMMSDATNEDPASTFDKVLTNCWVSTSSWGIYPEQPSAGKPDWAHVLSCDRYYALLEARLLTYPGMPYDFDIQCKNCKEMIEWSLRIEDLTIKDLPEASRIVQRGDKKFTTNARVRFARDKDTAPEALPERKVLFHLMDGAAERTSAAKLKDNPHDRIVASVFSRIISVSDIHTNDLWESLKATRLDVLMQLLDDFEEVDGGVETGIAVKCGECRYRNEVDLPLELKFFFRRKKKVTQGSRSFRSSHGRSS